MNLSSLLEKILSPFVLAVYVIWLVERSFVRIS